MSAGRTPFLPKSGHSEDRSWAPVGFVSFAFLLGTHLKSHGRRQPLGNRPFCGTEGRVFDVKVWVADGVVDQRADCGLFEGGTVVRRVVKKLKKGREQRAAAGAHTAAD